MSKKRETSEKSQKDHKSEKRTRNVKQKKSQKCQKKVENVRNVRMNPEVSKVKNIGNVKLNVRSFGKDLDMSKKVGNFKSQKKVRKFLTEISEMSK